MKHCMQILLMNIHDKKQKFCTVHTVVIIIIIYLVFQRSTRVDIELVNRLQ